MDGLLSPDNPATFAVMVVLSVVLSAAPLLTLSVNGNVLVSPCARLTFDGRPLSVTPLGRSALSVTFSATLPAAVMASVTGTLLPGLALVNAGSGVNVTPCTSGVTKVSVSVAVVPVPVTVTENGTLVPGAPTPLIGRKQMPTSAVCPGGTSISDTLLCSVYPGGADGSVIWNVSVTGPVFWIWMR